MPDPGSSLPNIGGGWRRYGAFMDQGAFVGPPSSSMVDAIDPIRGLASFENIQGLPNGARPQLQL